MSSLVDVAAKRQLVSYNVWARLAWFVGAVLAMLWLVSRVQGQESAAPKGDQLKIADPVVFRGICANPFSVNNKAFIVCNGKMYMITNPILNGSLLFNPGPVYCEIPRGEEPSCRRRPYLVPPRQP